ncbi:MAG TPA: enoyl-CoA hydratase-related protein [Acidimicrobiales bacterium]|nr:enoyl-CoA hydratase-related protein [Acidimicrobiales bacterium]
MSASHRLTEMVGHTLVLTINRPEARNALSPEMTQLLGEAWDEINSNPDIRVGILTGAGSRFCAGADLKAMTRQHPGDSFRAEQSDTSSDGGLADGVIKSLLKGFRLTKPLIAAVEGPAVAGGTEILQATDIRVPGESARFGVSEDEAMRIENRIGREVFMTEDAKERPQAFMEKRTSVFKGR